MVSQKAAIQVTELPEGSHIKLGPKIEKSASHTPQLQMMAKNYLRNKQQTILCTGINRSNS